MCVCVCVCVSNCVCYLILNNEAAKARVELLCKKEIVPCYNFLPIPAAAWFNAWVCGRSLAGIVGSLVRVVCCVGRDLCVGLITRVGESYQVWLV